MFQKSRNYLKILGARMMTANKFSIAEAQLLGPATTEFVRS